MTSLVKMRTYYDEGHTLSKEFRIQQLKKLANGILKYEHEINEALYFDLGKSVEESWATEIGLLLGEIKYAIKNIHLWMKPERVAGSLLTFPSSGKIYKEPLGVVLIIAPWNYPLQLMLAPLIGAIAAGNCVVLKPSEAAPTTEKLIEKLIKEIYDDHFVKVFTGEGSIVVPDLMNQFKFNHIFYTGSTQVGKLIYQQAAADLIPVTLELGGKSPCIVEADADITVTAKRIIFGKFINAGQTCIAPDYILVQETVKEKLLTEMANAIQQFYSSDPASSSDYGKIIHAKHFQRLVQFLHQGKIFYGGKFDESKLFIEPTILTDISLEEEIMKEEIFGPILPVIPFLNTQEAIEIVRKNKNPLSFYLFTKDAKKEKEWMQKISFGGGCINNTVWHFTNKKMAFGGIGNSGLGAYHGQFTFEIFSHRKPVLKSPTWFDPSIKYPPFKGKINLLKKIFK